MRITDVRAAVALSPFRWVIVQVRTDSGLRGLGETWYTPGVLEALQQLKPLVVGEDPHNIEMLSTKLLYGKQEAKTTAMDWDACVARYGLAGGAVVEGPTTMAASGVEIALFDLIGKALGTPTYNLLGGRFRSWIRMYADLHLPESDDDPVRASIEAAQEAIAEGFDAVKVDLDLAFPELHRDPWNRSLSGAEVERSYELVSALVGAVGPGVYVALDCHWQFSPQDALRLARKLEELHPFWLEDPIPLGNPTAMASIAQSSSVPICTGEYSPTAERLYPYLEQRACHVIHPDVCYAGVLETKKMAALAAIQVIPCALHNSGGPIATVASAHVAAATRNFLTLENHNQGVPWWKELVDWNGVEVSGGHVDLSNAGPGLGVALNHDACKRYVEDHEVLF